MLFQAIRTTETLLDFTQRFLQSATLLLPLLTNRSRGLFCGGMVQKHIQIPRRTTGLQQRLQMLAQPAQRTILAQQRSKQLQMLLQATCRNPSLVQMVGLFSPAINALQKMLLELLQFLFQQTASCLPDGQRGIRSHGLHFRHLRRSPPLSRLFCRTFGRSSGRSGSGHEAGRMVVRSIRALEN